MNSATAILVGDLHLMDRQPQCRTDDFWKAQEKKILWLRKLQEKHQCPVLCAGDVFDKWNSSLELVGWAIRNLPYMYTIYGQHDLPQHNLSLAHRSAVNVVQSANRIFISNKGKRYSPFDNFELYGYNYGQPYKSEQLKTIRKSNNIKRKIAVRHIMTYSPKLGKPFPDCTSDNARVLLKKMKEFDLILTGDNHQAFVLVDGPNERLLVNPGSFTRISADQIDHKPRVYLWWAEHNQIRAEFVPIEEGVVTREHIEIKQEKDRRIEVFIKKLNEQMEIGLSFEENMNRFFNKNKVKQGIVDLIWEVMEG